MQTEKLQASEEELRVQQEELQQANQELEERSKTLEERNHQILEKKLEVQRNADQLANSTKYKSEFLANMSHELRTPLNSILLLSRLLSENTAENLNADQVEYARVIQSSGNGLLSLIDEILDLSKIEAGKMKLEYERYLRNEYNCTTCAHVWTAGHGEEARLEYIGSARCAYRNRDRQAAPGAGVEKPAL
jgi:signal transduction histidine kinase